LKDALPIGNFFSKIRKFQLLRKLLNIKHTWSGKETGWHNEKKQT